MVRISYIRIIWHWQCCWCGRNWWSGCISRRKKKRAKQKPIQTMGFMTYIFITLIAKWSGSFLCVSVHHYYCSWQSQRVYCTCVHQSELYRKNLYKSSIKSQYIYWWWIYSMTSQIKPLHPFLYTFSTSPRTGRTIVPPNCSHSQQPHIFQFPLSGPYTLGAEGIHVPIEWCSRLPQEINAAR